MESDNQPEPQKCIAVVEEVWFKTKLELGEAKEKIVDLKRQCDQIVRRGNEVARERDASNAECRSLQIHFQTLTRMATTVGQQNDLLKAQVAVLQERAVKAIDALLKDKAPSAEAIVKAINLLTFGTEEDQRPVMEADAEKLLKATIVDEEPAGKGPNVIIMPMALMEEIDPKKAQQIRDLRDPQDPFKLIEQPVDID